MRKACRLAEPDQLGDGLEFSFDEHPGRVAAAVLLDGQRVDRRDSGACDARAPQRLRIGAGDQRKRAAPEAPDRADVDQVVWRRGVELLPRWPALLGEDVRY